jgi:hypothetical protein
LFGSAKPRDHTGSPAAATPSSTAAAEAASGHETAATESSSRGITFSVTSVMKPVMPSAPEIRSSSGPVSCFTSPDGSTSRAESTFCRNQPYWYEP